MSQLKNHVLKRVNDKIAKNEFSHLITHNSEKDFFNPTWQKCLTSQRQSLTLLSIYLVLSLGVFLESVFLCFFLLYLCLTCFESVIMPRMRRCGNYRQLSEFDNGEREFYTI